MRQTRIVGILLCICTALPVLAAQPGKIALIQYQPDKHFAAPDINKKNLIRLANEAVQGGANILVFPEGSTYGYDGGTVLWCKPGMKKFRQEGMTRNCRDVSEVAESVPQGGTSQYWRSFAISNKVYILFSVLESEGGQFYNTHAVATPDGKILKYRKRFFYTVEFAYASHGSESLVVDTPYGRFGVLICIEGADSDDPSLEGEFDLGYYQNYKRMGVDAIIIPMNWGDYDPHSSWSAQNIFRARAKKNQLDIYVSDAWDGTAKYRADGERRERNGLSPYAPQSEGITYHSLNY